MNMIILKVMGMYYLNPKVKRLQMDWRVIQ